MWKLGLHQAGTACSGGCGLGWMAGRGSAGTSSPGLVGAHSRGRVTSNTALNPLTASLFP